MDGKKALYYAAIAIAILVGVSILVSVLSAIVSLAWAVISGVISLAILAGIVYVAYKAGKWLLGGNDDGYTSSTASASTGGSRSRQDRLRQQYVEGQISEEEFEQRIASELETEEIDEIDRELERER